MGLLQKAKQIRELGRQLKAVKQEMKQVEVGTKGLKTRARKTRELVNKMRSVRGKMTDWEVGELAKAADKEGKKLDKLIELAEARERVTKAKISVRAAQERLRRPKVRLGPKKKTKITFSMPTVKFKKKAKSPKRRAPAKLKKKAELPRRKAPRITPKTPRLRR